MGEGGLVVDYIELKNLTRTYYDARGESFCALNNVSFLWNAGHSVAIMGESGGGKSTLARLIIGLERPSKGMVEINGEDTTKWSFSKWRRYRTEIQAVFQDASGTLNPAWSTLRNVEEAMCNCTNFSRTERKQKIEELLELTGLRKDLLDIPVRKLSGGEQRRLALLRSLSLSPKFLVLDEVTAGLDIISTEAVLQLLEQYQEKHDCSYLIITHEMQIALRLCKMVYEIENGKLSRKPFKYNTIKERN